MARILTLDILLTIYHEMRTKCLDHCQGFDWLSWEEFVVRSIALDSHAF